MTITIGLAINDNMNKYLKNEPIYCKKQPDGKYYIFQYFILSGIVTDKFIIAEDIVNENAAKTLMKILEDKNDT